MLVFGEALLNDAVAIVLYKSFAKFAKYNGESVYFTYGDLAVKFVALTLGSIAVGLVCGVVQALIFKFVFFKHTAVLEVIVFLTLAYSSFLIAEYFHFSGIIASLLHGMMAATFVKKNMSAAGHTRAFILTNTIASFADMMIFIMTGIIATVGVVNDISWSFTGFTMVFVLVGRACAVFPLISLLNLCRAKERRISCGKSAAMWYAGLRGAIAIGLVVGVPTALRHMMLSTTVAVVLATVFIMGGSTAPFLKIMGIKMGGQVTNNYEAPKLSPRIRSMSIRMQKALVRLWLFVMFVVLLFCCSSRTETKYITDDAHSHFSCALCISPLLLCSVTTTKMATVWTIDIRAMTISNTARLQITRPRVKR